MNLRLYHGSRGDRPIKKAMTDGAKAGKNTAYSVIRLKAGVSS